ncbi:glycosyltransferase family 2 protein [Zavarzinia aquatilis]|uniref:Glycosyltransferase n=1 Tax=Zavarzinia aquatilis TaxID=2211142 RepID=A0A317DTX2_9PROT|nr:glycosyltransferase family 2 protein [Zavarzinia aquatilis]PWR18137.1 glycosyltransferase [Zavarzinia aquatilis]
MAPDDRGRAPSDLAEGRDFAAVLAGPGGDHLVRCGLVSPSLREAAIVAARRHRADAIDCLLGVQPGVATRTDLAATLARGLGLELIGDDAEPPDGGLARFADLAVYGALGMMPWRRDGDAVVWACTAPDAFSLAQAERLTGGPAVLAVTTRPRLTAALVDMFGADLTRVATQGLSLALPEASAGTRGAGRLRPALFACGLAGALLAFAAPLSAALVAVTLITLFYLANLVLRALLVAAGLRGTPGDAPVLADGDLPHYTVLVPLYREPDILPLLADALDRLDYPRALLDVKLLLEADDAETIAAARALGLEDRFDLIAVPPSFPRTKPKACNFALPLARGRLLAIYDAEDRPESDQLRRAAAALVAGPPTLACVQARLNFFNADENWLTRMFALDYALWFDYLLPGLDRLGMAIPLGGTSNHFRIEALRAVFAWDPYNVTEDADLGLRLYRHGYTVSLIDSTTYEEATTRLPVWVRQRTRWLKGYMQTFAVQMRRPATLWRRLGPRAFFGFLAFIAGTFASALLNPLVWAAWGLWLVSGGAWLDPLFPWPVKIAGLCCWLGGNSLFLYLALVAPFRRRWFSLAPWALTITPYWALMSVAGWRALWQWLRQPFLWEKTTHGQSRRVRAALAGRDLPP